MKSKAFSVIEILVVFLVLSFLTFLAIRIYDSTTETASDLHAQQIIEVSAEAVLATHTTRGYWIESPAELGQRVSNISFSTGAVNEVNKVSMLTTADGVVLTTLSGSGNCLVGYVTSEGLKHDKYYNNSNCNASEAP